MRWLEGDDEAAVESSEGDQLFRTEREAAAQAASQGGGGRAIASNSLMHFEEHFWEEKGVQDEVCRGLDQAHAAQGLPVNTGIPSGTLGRNSGMAVGEQWGRAEQTQPWGAQSPVQRQTRAAEVIITLSLAMCMLFVHAHLSLSFFSDVLCQIWVHVDVLFTIIKPVCGSEQQQMTCFHSDCPELPVGIC